MGKDHFLGLREALALEWMEAHSVGPWALGLGDPDGGSDLWIGSVTDALVHACLAWPCSLFFFGSCLVASTPYPNAATTAPPPARPPPPKHPNHEQPHREPPPYIFPNWRTTVLAGLEKKNLRKLLKTTYSQKLVPTIFKAKKRYFF